MLRHAECGELSEGKQEEEAKEWVDDGSLPLEDGKLPFFLLDAHEELGTPGTLYLFGKARHMQHLHPTSPRCCRSKPETTACLAIPAFPGRCASHSVHGLSMKIEKIIAPNKLADWRRNDMAMCRCQ